MCLITGRPKNINFSFETNGKLLALGVPILKHIRVNAKSKSHVINSILVTFITALSNTLLLQKPTVCIIIHNE